ncbi:MAG: SPOR domain-containing protein [Nitrospinae bacterium]|nr:SPOR domain-containing protein [Nitrospinota bacterium]
MKDDNEFSDVDAGVLEEFESELAKENRSRRKKRLLIAGGVALGLALALFFATGGEESPAPPPPAPAQPSQPKPTAIEEQIAELQAQNQITEDHAVPGAVAEAIPAGEPSPAQEKPVPTATEPSAAPPAPMEAAAAKPSRPPAPEPVKPAEPVKLAPPAVTAPPAPEPAKPVETAKPPPPPTPAAKKEKGPFSVQMSANLESDKAFELRDKLAAAGHQSWMSAIKTRRELIRVEVGEFNSIKEAAPMSARLAQLGHATSATRLPNGQVTLVAGSFHSADNAQKLFAELEALGFPVKAARRAEEQPMYVVKVGRYPTRDAAARAEAELRANGYTTLGVVR